MTTAAEGPDSPARAELRRHVTVLFTDLSDSTRLSALLEAEVFAALQDDVRRAFDEVVLRYGGVINQYQGDGLQALFGEPWTREDDGLRATRVALEVHEQVRALRGRYALYDDFELSVHSGIHGGLVLVRQGNGIAGRFELFGATPGIAKHLSDVADRDEILVSDETLGPAVHFFEAGDQRRVLLKGRDEPLDVRRILARSSARTRFEAHAQRGLAAFVGRHAEMAWLDEALGRAREGRAKLVVISAAAGVGKTRLAEEFLRRAEAQGFAVSRGYCTSDLSAGPLQPLLQMLRKRFDGPEGMAAPALLAQAIAALPPQARDRHPELSLSRGGTASASGAALARRMLAALGGVFAALAESTPQLLFIDDWQWSDAATRQAVYALAQRAGVPLLLMVTTRPLEQGDAQLANADVLALGPLSEAEAEITIRSLLPTADPFLIGRICSHSGGNPLFLEELCHFASDAATSLEGVRGGSAWLETLIASRVARLAPAQRELLDTAAVVGTVVPAWLFRELTGHDAKHPLVTAMAAQDLLFPGEQPDILRFKHGITRDVVYGSIGLERRRAMHAEIARLVSTRDGGEAEHCEMLAYHCAGAADFAQGARYAEMAGDKAMAASSIDRAKAQYRATLGMLDRQPPTPARYQVWRSVVRRLGLATIFDPSREEKDVLRRAIDEAGAHGDLAGQAYAEYWQAYLSYALGESSAAVAQSEQSLVRARALQDAVLEVQARTVLGQALAAAADYGRALELLEGAAKAQRSRSVGGRPSPGIAYTLACRASVLGDLGCFEAAHACFDEALAALPGVGHEVEGSVLCWRSAVFLWQGRWQAALDSALAAHRVGEEVRSLYLFATSHGLAAYARWMLTGAAGSVRKLSDSATWLVARDKNLFVSLHHGWLCDALAARGQWAEARQTYARALLRTRKGDWIGAAMAARAMARLAASRHDRAAATRYLQMAQRAAERRGSPHERAGNELCRAQIAALDADWSAARHHLQLAHDAFERLQMDWHCAQARALHAGIPPLG